MPKRTNGPEEASFLASFWTPARDAVLHEGRGETPPKSFSRIAAEIGFGCTKSMAIGRARRTGPRGAEAAAQAAAGALPEREPLASVRNGYVVVMERFGSESEMTPREALLRAQDVRARGGDVNFANLLEDAARFALGPGVLI